MKPPLSRFAPSPSLAAREGNTPSAAGRPLRGGTGLERASFERSEQGTFYQEI